MPRPRFASSLHPQRTLRVSSLHLQTTLHASSLHPRTTLHASSLRLRKTRHASSLHLQTTLPVSSSLRPRTTLHVSSLLLCIRLSASSGWWGIPLCACPENGMGEYTDALRRGRAREQRHLRARHRELVRERRPRRKRGRGWRRRRQRTSWWMERLGDGGQDAGTGTGIACLSRRACDNVEPRPKIKAGPLRSLHGACTVGVGILVMEIRDDGGGRGSAERRRPKYGRRRIRE